MTNNMYDEANIDLEEMMYLQDVQDELDGIDEDTENEEDIYEDDYDLTPSFFDKQSLLKDDERRKIKVLHKPSGKIFSGILYGKCADNNGKYVFKMREVVSNKEIDPLKIKIFNLSDLVKKK